MKPDFAQLDSNVFFFFITVVTTLGGGCAEDQQCSGGLGREVGPTTCLNFICSCAIGMSLVDGKCRGPTGNSQQSHNQTSSPNKFFFHC